MGHTKVFHFLPQSHWGKVIKISVFVFSILSKLNCSPMLPWGRRAGGLANILKGKKKKKNLAQHHLNNKAGVTLPQADDGQERGFLCPHLEQNGKVWSTSSDRQGMLVVSVTTDSRRLQVVHVT